MATFIAETSPSLVKRYRDLLKSEWSDQTLREVFILLWQSIHRPADGAPEELLTRLNPDQAPAAVEAPSPKIVNRIREFALLVRDPQMPLIPGVFQPAKDIRL